MSAVAERRRTREAARRRRAPATPPAPAAAPSTLRWPWWIALGLLLLAAFLLRVVGADHGMPYAFNADENSHFVPRAIGLYGHGWNPDYFVNPPAYTYLLNLVFTGWFGGREGVSRTFATDPTEVWTVARVTTALLGTAAAGLLYLAAARLFDRRVGLLAAALLAFSFLPVFYSHLALNDVPQLAPICLALYAAAGIARSGRRRDYLIAGVAVGLAAATKYTAGIVVLAVVAAAALHGRAAARGLLVAGGAALLAFVAANPYVVLDFSAVWDGITHQSTASGDAQGKVGLKHENGFTYYLWTFTWGLGWIPLLAAVAAVPLLWRGDRRALWLLAPAPLLFVLFMGTQARFFGRWLLPIFPFVCLLAGYAAWRAVDVLGAHRPRLRPTIAAAVVVVLCGQGVVYSLHIAQVLSRDDTRNIARDWLVHHIPPRTRIVVEPIAPDVWAQDVGAPSPFTRNGNRWLKFATSRSRVNPDDPTGPLLPLPGARVQLEDYERVLRPDLVDRYEREGFCWVLTGSTQRGRAEAEPDEVPQAIAYYRRLEQRSRLAYRVSPFREGADPVEFNFDWTFDYYPLAYHRPGPVISVYRLTHGGCAT